LKQEPSLRARALALLARREYSRAELARRLAHHAETEAELDELLDALEQKRQLSDTRYAEARTRTMSRKYGAARILHELKSKGIEGELAQRVVSETSVTEVERARVAWRKRFRAPGGTREERARQARFLQSRGFSFDVIREVLKDEEMQD
jgi:regulatory protein